MLPAKAVSTALALVILLGIAGIDPASAAPTEPNETVSIESVYPNPVAHGDAGEYVVLQATQPTALESWTLSDGEDRVSLPNISIDDRVLVSTAPNRTRNLTSGRVVRVSSTLALANSGEQLRLERDGHTVDSLRYSDAPEGELGLSTDDGIEWDALGTTEFASLTGTGGTVRTFVLPDGRGVPADTLAAADDRILLAGYTLTARQVVDHLSNAASRGVEVRVLVDDSPVGGLTQRQAAALDRLVANNVTVSVIGGDRARYEFHHAKYAVVDDRALVTTENWKPAGTGGHASRGWGVVVSNPAIVTGLVDTFEADAGWWDATQWSRFRRGQSFEPARSPPSNETYPTQFEPQQLQADRIELLRAPDNAERRLVALIDNATDSVRVEQVSIGSRQQPFLQAALRAAKRGVRVRILLSGAWYVEEDNRQLVQWLNQRAAQDNLPLKAKIAAPRGRFEKIHAKGVIIDEDQVLVGSLNWNNHSARQNREVAVLVAGDAVGAYYTDVFRADWRGGQWRLTVGLAIAVTIGALLAGLVGRQIEFKADTGEDDGLERP